MRTRIRHKRAVCVCQTRAGCRTDNFVGAICGGCGLTISCIDTGWAAAATRGRAHGDTWAHAAIHAARAAQNGRFVSCGRPESRQTAFWRCLNELHVYDVAPATSKRALRDSRTTLDPRTHFQQSGAVRMSDDIDNGGGIGGFTRRDMMKVMAASGMMAAGAGGLLMNPASAFARPRRNAAARSGSRTNPVRRPIRSTRPRARPAPTTFASSCSTAASRSSTRA